MTIQQKPISPKVEKKQEPAPLVLDISGVIQKSTSEVAIADLTKKGFKQVKVLNQAVITKLITEAVDRVINQRAQKISTEERAKVIQESQAQFETMAREKVQRERSRISELERANEALLQETEELRGRLQKAEEGKLGHGSETLLHAIMEKLQGGGASPGSLGKLENSIQRIAERLDRLPSGGAGGPEVMDKDVILTALFREEGPGAESNITKVKIKQEKAGGVKDTLAKLKALQKGGQDGE